MKLTAFIPGIIWFIISTILLCIPGNDLPKSSLFDFPFFDKLVHLAMFFLLTALFCYPFKAHGAYSGTAARLIFLRIALLVLAYGIAMEFVQRYWVAARSFDVTDILFDGLGSFAGMVASQKILLKNRPR